MKRKKRKGKEGFPIKDRKKAKKGKIGGKHNNSRSIKETRKENIRSSDQINVRRGKWPPARGKPILKWFFLWDCHSRLLPTSDVPPRINKEEKTETPSFLSKNTTLEKILFDPWSRVQSFGLIGNHVQNKVRVQLWFGIGVKHLPVWVFIHHEWFYSQFRFDPTFPLNVHLKAKRWHPTFHFRLQGKLFLA